MPGLKSPMLLAVKRLQNSTDLPTKNVQMSHLSLKHYRGPNVHNPSICMSENMWQKSFKWVTVIQKWVANLLYNMWQWVTKLLFSPKISKNTTNERQVWIQVNCLSSQSISKQHLIHKQRAVGNSIKVSGCWAEPVIVRFWTYAAFIQFVLGTFHNDQSKEFCLYMSLVNKFVCANRYCTHGQWLSSLQEC